MNAGFLSPNVDVRTSDGRNFTVIAALQYRTALGAVLTVPAGTTTDGASIPALLWSTLPPFGKYWLAALLHDWLYRNTQMPRIECDDLLLEAMISLGVDAVTAKTIYDGVRLCGQSSFDRDRAAQSGA